MGSQYYLLYHFGKIGGILAIFGMLAAPITSGDTAFRSTRLTIVDSLNYGQDKLLKRFVITIPIFLITLVLTKIDFDIIWRYFGWSNQVLATVVLSAIAVYVKQKGKTIWFVLIPSTFMTAVVTTYILAAPEGFRLNYILSYIIGISISIILTALFLVKSYRK